jgi:hypothetical protein
MLHLINVVTEKFSVNVGPVAPVLNRTPNQRQDGQEEEEEEDRDDELDLFKGKYY